MSGDLVIQKLGPAKHRGRRKQRFCWRGHDMEIHKKVYPNGDTYCAACKTLRYDVFRKANPEQVAIYQRRHKLKKTYGLSEQDFASLLQSQGGGCAICGIKDIGEGRSFHVDHNHETGEVRGILCHGCNTGLGLFKEDKSLLWKAQAYLAKGSK